MTDRPRTTTPTLGRTIDASGGEVAEPLLDRRLARFRQEHSRRGVSWPAIWRAIRPALGWICIVIGLLGVVLPIFPGMPFLVPGIALVGRRNRLIRWSSVTCKRTLRRLAPLQTPLLGPLARWALRAQHEFSRRRRRLAWRHMEYRRSKSRGGTT